MSGGSTRGTAAIARATAACAGVTLGGGSGGRSGVGERGSMNGGANAAAAAEVVFSFALPDTADADEGTLGESADREGDEVTGGVEDDRKDDGDEYIEVDGACVDREVEIGDAARK